MDIVPYLLEFLGLWASPCALLALGQQFLTILEITEPLCASALTLPLPRFPECTESTSESWAGNTINSMQALPVHQPVMPFNQMMMPCMMTSMMAYQSPTASTLPILNNRKRRPGVASPGLIDLCPGMAMGNAIDMNTFAAQAAKTHAEELHRMRHEAADREAAHLKGELKAAHAAAADVEQQVTSLSARLAAAEGRAAEAQSHVAQVEGRAAKAEAALRDRRAEAAAKRMEEIAALKAALKDGEHQRVERRAYEWVAEERRMASGAMKMQCEATLLAEQRAEVAERELHSLRISKGMIAAELQTLRDAAQSSTRVETSRRLSRTNAAQQQELNETREAANKALQVINELKQQPESTTRQQSSQQQHAPSQQQQAASSAASPPIFSTCPLKDGGRYRPIVLVLVRLLVTSGHVPQCNIPTVIDMCFTLFTGRVPGPDYQIGVWLVAESLRKLGTVDKKCEVAAAAADPNPYSVNSDTGDDGVHREVAAIGAWDEASDEPVAMALCCTHIANDQSGRNGADVLERQLELGGRRPELCAGAGGDSTSHAGGSNGQREGLRSRLEAKGLETGHMLLYGCVRHFIELELKAAFGAGWPGNVAENFLYSLRDVIHKDVPFWRKVWADSGAGTGPVIVYDSSLASMPIPTTSKWECIDVSSSKFIATREVSEARQGIDVSMIEEFVHRARELLRGTTDVTMPQKAGTHGDKEKFNVLAVDLQNVQLMGSIYATLDLAREYLGPFHQWCKEVCPIYGIRNDFKAHLMAVEACEQADFWVRAEADPRVAFPLLHSFMQRSFNREFVELMNSEAKSKLTARMKVAIRDGKAKNAEWMLTQYTAAPFLFGVVTDERHRLLAAQAILAASGHGTELAAALAKAQLAAAQPVGAVQHRLHSCFQREAANGELCVWWTRWGFEASLSEWLLLATAPAQNYHNPVLRRERTPTAWRKLRPLLVLMPHNTRLESYVSKMKQLQQGHNTTATNVNFIFKHHASMEQMRSSLSSWAARSTDPRAATRAVVQAKAGRNHGLKDTQRSKVQRQGLLMLTINKELPRYPAKRLYSRGKASTATALRAAECADKAVMAAVPERRLSALQQTHISGPCRARAAIKPAAAHAHKAPQIAEAGAKVPKQRGTGRSAADIAAHSKAARAAKAAERPSQAGKPQAPTAAQKRKQKQEEAEERNKRQAVPVEERRAAAEARAAEAHAAAKRVAAEAREAEACAAEKRVREEAERWAEEEREAKRVRSEERDEYKQLKKELNAWEARNGRKLKGPDLDASPELRAMYSRYRELSSSQGRT